MQPVLPFFTPALQNTQNVLTVYHNVRLMFSNKQNHTGKKINVNEKC
ncbi:hypothetical protein SAMN02746065_13029 [Desulfocicer vacuolatum DSM 3385]|uniref:Uncharacterized protein n=1 Tax=Desulfocicer vacuolatum DSM 3385 TaxID=1121400 RepID=A0A1W2EGT1_9BACT|nr:hypothetical protein SAMN02746065_13029 [Desulfocicer vacuolatum DSM 3385]